MSTTNGANLGFEQKLWEMADKLRGNMDAAEYKHVVLGLIFLKYISDAFEEQARRARSETNGRRPRRPRRIPAENIFWVPQEARWSTPAEPTPSSRPSASSIDDAMIAIERDNPSLKGVLPKDYARPRSGQAAPGRAHRPRRHHRAGRQGQPSKDVLGPRLRVLPQRIRQRRGQEGRPVLHAAARRPAARRDARALQRPHLRPLLRLRRHVRAESRSSSQAASAASIGDIAIYGQESNPTTWRLAR